MPQTTDEFSDLLAKVKEAGCWVIEPRCNKDWSLLTSGIHLFIHFVFKWHKKMSPKKQRMQIDMMTKSLLSKDGMWFDDLRSWRLEHLVMVKLCRMNAAYWKSCHRHYQEVAVFKVVVRRVEENHGFIVDIEIISPGCKWKKEPMQNSLKPSITWQVGERVLISPATGCEPKRKIGVAQHLDDSGWCFCCKKNIGSCKLNKWFTMSFGEWVVQYILCITYLVYIFIFSMILRCCVCSSKLVRLRDRTLAFDLPGSIWPTCFQSADDWFDSNWGSRTCPQLKCLKIDPTMCWLSFFNKTEHEN